MKIKEKRKNLKTDFTKPNSDKIKQFIEQFKKKSTGRKLVFGFNIYSKAIIARFEIDGIVEDNRGTKRPLPIVPLSSLKENDLVIVCSGGKINSAVQQVKTQGVNFIHYFDFKNNILEKLPDIVFNKNFKEEYEKNYSKFNEVFLGLADEKSAEIYENIMAFRYSENIDYLKSFEDNQANQYFESFLNLGANGEVFYDIGAFDGKNSLDFIKFCPNYLEVNLFEPENQNFLRLQSQLALIKRLRFHNCALSNNNNFGKISSKGTNSSIFSGTGTEVIFRELDYFLGKISPPTYMKMDIEGAENLALQGSFKTIKKYSPRMAIASYHRVEDLWKIPMTILNLNANYECFVRHYTESIYETISYFLLRDKNGANS